MTHARHAGRKGTIMVSPENDLYVVPHARGRGLAEALIDRCVTEGARHGAAKLNWITRPDNHRAQAVYDRVARRDPWLTYRIDLPARARAQPPAERAISAEPLPGVAIDGADR